jgi:protein phosphatase
MKSQLTWSAGAVSNQGRREENQDRMTRFSTPFGEVVVVADGMGGQRGGATAASAVVRMLPDILRQTQPNIALGDALSHAIRTINAEIYREGHGGDASVARMGTTVVIAVLRESAGVHEALIANIGDSRAYLFRGGALRQISKDHSTVQRLVDAGALTPEEARLHPESSMLSRAIGQQPDVELEFYPPVRLQPGDGLLLCSDGLSGYVDDARIGAVLNQPLDAAAAVSALEALALSSGSDDNITIQYLRLGGRPAVAPPKPRRRYALAGAVAAGLCIVAVGVRWWTPPPRVTTIEIRIGNATGEKPPKVVEKQPTKPPVREIGKNIAIFFVDESRPQWLAKARKLACVDYVEHDRGELEGKLGEGDPSKTRIYFRKDGRAMKDCLRREIPELAGAEAKEVAKLPNDASVIVVVAKPPKEDSVDE